MAKCAACGRKGLFLKLNNQGLCSQCELAKKESAQQEELRKKEEIRQKREDFLKRKLFQAQQELDNLPHHNIVISDEKRVRQKGFEEVSFSNITPKGKYNEFVVFDTETTGLAPFRDRIVEIAAIRFVNGSAIEIFETLVNPGKNIPDEVSSINHITNEMVSNAPTISQVLPAFESFVGSSPLVAHNLEFDLKFLYYSGSYITRDKRKYFDTLEQAKKLLKKPRVKYDREYDIWETDYESDYDVEDYKLETLCDYYNIIIPYQHRAASDALATGKLFLSLVDEKQNK